MQSHHLAGSSETVLHINTFQRALEVSEHGWSNAPQVVSWDQGSPFIGVAGRCEEDLAGRTRVWLIGPATDLWGPYVRVLRVDSMWVCDTPITTDAAQYFCASLDSYRAEGMSETSWLRANAELRRWSDVVDASIADHAQVYRQYPRTQRWLDARNTMPYEATGYKSAARRGRAQGVA